MNLQTSSTGHAGESSVLMSTDSVPVQLSPSGVSRQYLSAVRPCLAAGRVIEEPME